MWFGSSLGGRKRGRRYSLLGSFTKASRRARGRTLRLEPLEERKLLAAMLYVNDNWDVDVDNGPLGLSNGDEVVPPGGEGSLSEVAIYGTNAFSTIQEAIDAASPGDDTSPVCPPMSCGLKPDRFNILFRMLFAYVAATTSTYSR